MAKANVRRNDKGSGAEYVNSKRSKDEAQNISKGSRPTRTSARHADHKLEASKKGKQSK